MRHQWHPSTVDDDHHYHDIVAVEHRPPAPTEKSVSPTGGNLFTPGVKAPPAPAVPPGQHPGINGIP